MTWLLIDCDYLCHRSFHAMGSLSHQGKATGVTYGFLRDVIDLQELHGTTLVAFCFDSRVSFRRVFHPEYKSNRDHSQDLMFEIKQLRKEYLPAIGYRNIFFQKGYEADDVIAVLASKLKDVIVVSSDHDLYQILSSNVRIWHPQQQQMVTADSFSRNFGVSPSQWIDVKAIAGCATDCVKGIHGVGERTAAKFLNGSLNPKSKIFSRIVAGNDVWERNRQLVKVPYPGIGEFEIQEDQLSVGGWLSLCDRFGMRSIRSSFPVEVIHVTR